MMRLAICLLLVVFAAHADSKTEVQLRAELAASQAALAQAQKDKAALINANKVGAGVTVGIGKQVAANAVASLAHAKDAQLAAANSAAARVSSDQAKTASDHAAAMSVSTAVQATKAADTVAALVTPAWMTFAGSIVAAAGALIALIKAKQTHDLVLKVELSINGRMSQLIEAKDALLEVAKTAAIAQGITQGKSEEHQDIEGAKT
jgi:hypothetical protein